MTTKKPTHSTALYIPAGFYLLRTPVLPANVYTRLSATSPQHDHEAVTEASCYQLLHELVEQPQIRLAVAVASPSLLESIERLRAGKASAAQAERTYKGVLRYLIRMSSRPTPFGLFAGVALGTFTGQTSAQLALPPIASTRTRTDMGWLLEVIQKMEQLPELVHQLRVRSNQTTYIAGGRLLLPRADIYGQQDGRAISLRATPVVLKTVQLAQHGIPYPELVAALQATYPQATTRQIEQMLSQLWDHHILIGELHPPLNEAQPARYLAEQLASVHGIDQVKTALEEILVQSAELDEAGANAPLALLKLKKLERSQAQLVEDEKYRPVQIDTALRLKAAGCHQHIAEAAAQAAELLLRMTPLPQGSPGLQEYRHQFLEKYGPGAEVPVLELLSPECGLGVPPSFFRPPRFFYTNASAKRERVLHELAQDALNCHALEVELNEAQIAALQTWNPRVEQAPHSLEIYLQVQAASREALDRGHWCTVVSPNPGSPNGGRSFGRFFDLLGEAGLHALRDLLAREEALEPESIFAELNYQPWHARSANVAIRPGLHTHEIAVGTTPTRSPEHVILLRDLVVGIHNDRFYLRSLSRNKKVIVRQLHMLNIAQAPPVCRFLSDIASDGMPVLASFDWGSLSIAPFLPRLTIRQAPHASLVLSPARWTLEATTLQRQGQGNGEARRFSLRDFRTRWRVPRYVYLTEADNRLLLDLEHPLMVAELFQALDTLKEGQQVVLQEVLPDLEHLWLRDTDGAPYFSEIVVPLLRRDALESSIPLEVSPQAKTFPPVPHHVSSQVRVCYPGDAWNYIKLYCTPEQQEAIIARPLRELIAQLREQQRIDRWFFVRYADPQPHLRVRIHAGTSEQVQPALHFLLSWSRQLATQGLIQRSVLDTYEREVARYGGPAAIDLLEEVFSIDSDICTNLVAAQYAHHLALDPLAVAVVSLDRFFSAWNYDTDRRLQWLQKRTEKYAFSKEFHRKRRYYSELLASWEQADPELASQRSTLYEFTPFENHLSSLAPQVRALDRAGNLWGTEEDLLASLAHMHNVRLLGLDTSKEQHVYAFWRHALVSISAQQKRG